MRYNHVPAPGASDSSVSSSPIGIAVTRRRQPDLRKFLLHIGGTDSLISFARVYQQLTATDDVLAGNGINPLIESKKGKGGRRKKGFKPRKCRQNCDTLWFARPT